jgi:plastocyanin
MTKCLAVLSSVVALGLVASGCGGGNDNNSSSGGGGGASKTPAKQPATSGGTAAKTVQVSMKNIQFSPKSISVAKGTTVKWTNDEGVNHDVTKTGGPGTQFSSGKGNLAQGDTYQQKFDTPGTIKYVCTVHAPGMSGTITVK